MLLIYTYGLADTPHRKSNLFQSPMVEDKASIKDEAWLTHGLIDAHIIESLKFVPLGANNEGIGIGAGFIGVVVDGD